MSQAAASTPGLSLDCSIAHSGRAATSRMIWVLRHVSEQHDQHLQGQIHPPNRNTNTRLDSRFS